VPNRRDTRQTLIFDADDTLWENNIYFERAIDEFMSFLDHSTLSHAEVRVVLNEIERANTKTYGYGARSFSRSLHETFLRLAEREVSDADLDTISAYGERIIDQEIELMPGVEETLTGLGVRHDLVLCTKGHAEDQRLKIERSGIGDRFSHHEIVAEKDAATYRDLVSRLGSDPSETWMIGNSPRSDINPAFAAGLGAVFIPHPHTWGLEHDDVDHSHERLLVLTTFSRLTEHF
jgi:putative hydrolase of the HAD superfamily